MLPEDRVAAFRVLWVVLGMLLFVLGVRWEINRSVSPGGIAVRTKSPVVGTVEIVDTPIADDISMETLVPYAGTSVWNSPIGISPRYDPYSEQMIASLLLANDGKIITPDDFNYPVYFVDADTPRWDVPCTVYRCSIALSDNEVLRSDVLEDVPIPSDARPAPDSDGRMIVIDKDTYTEYDFWRIERTTSGWKAANGSVYNIQWNGTPVRHTSRGAGIPSYAGLLRPWEILQGKVEHALAVGIDFPAKDKCVFPASKTDGDNPLRYAIPEGARLQLDPSLTDTDFEQMGLDKTGKIIARALQEYGMIVVDHSGSFKLYLEDLTNNPYATVKWSDPELNLTKTTISSIPYTAFRVLELPPGYWGETQALAYHGRCFAFPEVP